MTGMDEKREYIATAGQIVGNVEHWTTEYSWDGTRWATMEDAIDHGFKVFGCDDFSTAALVGDEVVWKGWMREEHADTEDRQGGGDVAGPALAGERLMGRYDLPDPICWRKHHKPAGTMSNQPGTEPYNPDRPHASAHVCTRTECQDDAREWVRAHTHESAVFTTFEQNRAARREREGKPSPAVAACDDAPQMALPIGGAS